MIGRQTFRLEASGTGTEISEENLWPRIKRMNTDSVSVSSVSSVANSVVENQSDLYATEKLIGFRLEAP